ncbi:head-tail adaptor protein [Bacillus phage Ray17]|uniref:Head-tail adaptor protein n=1 Tax=Bacillus phage Ray17 TaxID=2315627 RepID=A0A386K9M3_9CAUD|nr:head-tail adaptor protein [Bacillus phage Ray17]AYD80966.1 head-tail adaptor protein [Bacillus phage Ray17]
MFGYEEFPHVVVFQSYQAIKDSGGGKTYEWQDEFSSEAHVQPVSQNEYYTAMQLETPIGYNVYVPYDDRINGKMRIVHDGRIINFVGDPSDLSGLKEKIRIKGKEGEPDGTRRSEN